MAEPAEFQVGQRIELADGKQGIVRYVGDTQFAAGSWVGVELEDASGKNNGAVQGQRYFDCPPAHGMFVRPAAVAVIEQPQSKPASRMQPKANGTVSTSRPSSMVAAAGKRQSLVDPRASQRQSLNASSPSPGLSNARQTVGSQHSITGLFTDVKQQTSRSPSKRPGTTASSISSSRTGTPTTSSQPKAMPPPSKPNRTSMGPPSLPSVKKGPRPSIAGTLNGSAKQPGQASFSRGLARPPTMSPGPRARIGLKGTEEGNEGEKEESSPERASDAGLVSPSILSDDQRNGLVSPVSDASTTSRAPPATKLSQGRSPSTTPQRPPSHAVLSNREVDDLKTKLRVMEKKRAEDRERMKALERLQTERDKFEGIIQKLQAKYQPQQQELLDLKRQIQEDEDRVKEIEGKLAEHDTLLEMATLDREMAEETAESLKLELEALRQKHEEIELEVTVLREENEELGKEISPEEKTSQGWLQLERSNVRLREALMRLRDVTQERELDLKAQIEELEGDTEQFMKLKEEYVLATEKLEQSNAIAKELRQQLESALGAEDMIEELTEKNMSLGEKMEELKMTIDEMENLKELNDELEVNHVENEKQLQEELDYQEALLSEEARKAALQDGTIQDLEYTVSRFRELVTTMQSDLEDMRANQQLSEAEANELNNRTRAMMDLNMQLQTTASKTQVKAIDLELGRLQAQESSEHLSIVQSFLPDTFQSEQASVQAFLRLRRLSFKAHMMHNSLRERLTSQASLLAEEDLPALCEVLDKLVWVSSTCQRFTNYVQTCELEAFKRMGAASIELEPVERSFNVWIDSLKRDDLKFDQCASELHRSIVLIDHLAEVHVGSGLDRFPDLVLAHVAVMQSHFETAAGLLGILKSRLENSLSASEENEMTDESEQLDLFEKLDGLISQNRSARVIVGKATRQVEVLQSRSLTLDTSATSVLEHTQEITQDLTTNVRSLFVSTFKSLAHEEPEAEDPFSRISNTLVSGTTSLSMLSSKIQVATSQVQILFSLTNNLSQTVEFPSPPPPPPWRVLAQKMREDAADLVAREAELVRLKDDVSERKNNLAIKDKMLEELSVKNEVLEKRVSESGSRREKVKELEVAAESSKAREKDYVAKLTRLHDEVQSLRAEKETLKEAIKTAPGGTQNAPATTTAPASASSLLHIETLEAEIASLNSTVRYLRTSHHQTSLSASNAYLALPLVPPPQPRHHLEAEAKDVLREMLHLVSQPASEPVKLRRRAKEDRLQWRPIRETSQWQVQRQKEEWQEWKEWRDGVAHRARLERREASRRRELKNERMKEESVSAAKTAVKVGEGEGEVKIVDDGGSEA